MHRTASLFLIGFLMAGIGLAACNGDPPPDQGGQISYMTSLFYEDWESYSVGSFPGGGWKDDGGQYNMKVIQNPPNHKLYLEGPVSPSNSLGGVYHMLPEKGIRPTYIRFKSHPYPLQDIEDGSAFIGYFLLRGPLEGRTDMGFGIRSLFIHDENGEGIFSVNAWRFPVSSYVNIDKSWTIELKNIEWDIYPRQLFDLWVNGVEVDTCIPFMMRLDVFSRLDLYNDDFGGVHYDDILMADTPIEHHCRPELDEPAYPDEFPPLPPMPGTVTPTHTITPLNFIVDLDAFCRFGPGTNYHKVAYFPAGTSLNVNGQNEEGTWWWIEEAGCWLSDKVGQLEGPLRPVRILTPPPPPTWTPTPGGEPGKPPGCYEGMKKDECEASGGTWVDETGKPDHCECPQ
jgi:hypothetical protein